MHKRARVAKVYAARFCPGADTTVMYPTVNDPSEGLRDKRSHWVKALFVLILGLFLTLGSPHSATALSDTQLGQKLL